MLQDARYNLEGRRFSGKDPHVGIGRLLAEKGREKAGDPADFHLEHVVRRFSRHPGGRERFLPGIGDGELDEPWFWRGRHQ